MTPMWKGSPNYSKDRKAIDTVVLHWFGIGSLESANARFQNPDAKSSAHYGISDNKVWQWVKEEHVAWHAGNYPVNQRSIGIEHDATTTKNASDATYQTSAQLLREICGRYAIPLDRQHIIGHNEVAATQCPGTLNIDKIISLAKQDMTPDEQRTLEVIGDYQKRTDHTNLEGAARHAVGAADVLPDRERELDEVRREVSDLKKAVDILRVQVDDLAEKLIEKEKSEADWQRSLTLANRRVSTLEEELEAMTKERTAYKRRYEDALDQKADKLTAWELLKLFIQKLPWKE